MDSKGWIGVDLDGTLAHYDGWKGELVIGEPVPLMVARVKSWLADGVRVKVFTARVNPRGTKNPERVRACIQRWCRKHIGRSLPVTHEKDLHMVQLWDDRCVQVIQNTGAFVQDTSLDE